MVFEYGLFQPEKKEDQELITQQLRASYEYYNTLIKIEQDRRSQVQKVQLQYPNVALLETEVAGILAEIELHRTAIQNTRSTNRKNIVDKKDVDRVKSLKANLRAKRDLLKIEKKALNVDPTFLLQCEAIQSFAKNEHKKARKETKSFWGSYLLIENAVDAAKKSKTPPKTKHWDFTGRLGAQIQKGMSVSELFGNDTRIQIDPISIDAWDHPIRGIRKKAQRTKLRLRVNSTDKGKPIFVEFPMIMHRPIPPKACIKQATVIVRSRDRDYCYSLQLTVNLPDAIPSLCTNGIGVDLGWRLMESGEIRVAYGFDQKGTKIDLRLPGSIPALFQKAEDLRAIRDKKFEEQRKNIVSLIKPFANFFRLDNIEFSKSFRRFHSLYMYWKFNRQVGDELAFDALYAWHKSDRHLEQYEVGCRKRAMNHRREVYRKFAKDIATKYGFLAIEKDFDMSKIALRALPEDGTKEQNEPQHQRVMACVSMLRQILKNTAKREGVSIVDVPAAYTTLQCSGCQKINDWNTAKNVVQTCAQCDTVWDQDENAARNLLASGSVLKNSAPSLAQDNIPKTDKISRWAKRKTKVANDLEVDRSQIAS